MANRPVSNFNFETTLHPDEMIVSMGPQHPSTHGVLRVILKLDGETVTDLDCDIGYLHRGAEKIFEHRVYPMIAPYFDRLDYIAAVSNGLVYVETVEKAMAIEVPARAQYLRVILTELNRLSSHLLWLGTHALDIGAFTVLLWAFREREEILKIFENFFGARLTCHAFRIGGMTYDAYDEFEAQVTAFIEMFPKRLEEYETMLNENRIWLGRTVGVGIISGKDAIDLGLSGPPLRGSGVEYDVRKSHPYECYADLDFDIPIGENGDTFDRYLIRMEEMRQSRRLIQQALKKLPGGPVMAKVPKVIRPPAGELYHSNESPKGELGLFLVADGSTQPVRLRVRPPSFVNLQALKKMAVGSLIADVVAVIGTLDIVLGEIDR
ncbi:MAG TPA: NADH-quinone oxidoreductase subunit D [Acidobacteriota bacterium]|nr:NADH-quinone oxidoreductase subunit D [Acidobacteriota bacterium]HNB70433.1 NADH-quinone oxidoreductase subunit D [Acidobacteriota bacterium]HNC45914.1 NADH-quinone oxidoreductase subunit D [Acidobacteriota bacterium]HND21766.1 NADH-quinone oxidoreductase subunit D [Acidobacteriota bacterium]HNG91352.1 NADH-quinone oxidoreductase subunit D [Acidobacteriota bacterium]